MFDRLYPYISPQKCDRFFDRCQPNACACVGVLCMQPLKDIKNLFLIFRGNANSIVFQKLAYHAIENGQYEGSLTDFLQDVERQQSIDQV